jgi:sarcosine oxidase, subunit gamma
MSEAVTALRGRSFTGSVTVEDAGPVGMVTVRAVLSDEGVRAALATAGAEVPEAGGLTWTDDGGTLWMSPDEVLILCAAHEAAGKASALARALDGSHALVADVSQARIVIRLTGRDVLVREVLAKLSPADLRASALPPGQVRRTRLGQVAAAFWFTSDGEAMLICFRSVADYVFALLSNAAAPGSDVGHF